MRTYDPETLCDCGAPDIGVGVMHEPGCPSQMSPANLADALRNAREENNRLNNRLTMLLENPELRTVKMLEPIVVLRRVVVMAENHTHSATIDHAKEALAIHDPVWWKKFSTAVDTHQFLPDWDEGVERAARQGVKNE